jgi:hypothetical protein
MIIVVNETLVRVMIDDMDSLDDLVDSSVDGNARSLLLALNTDVLGQIAMFLKPDDVYSLSLTCMHFKENGKLMMRTMIKAQLDCVMEDRTKRLDQTGTLKSFTLKNMFQRDAQARAADYDVEGRSQVRYEVTFDVTRRSYKI